MLKRSCLIAIAAVSAAMFVPAQSEADHYGNQGDFSAVLEAGGGPLFFSSRNALEWGYGKAKIEEEVKKLEAQFGEGKVYRFFAVGDFMMKDGFRICSLHHGMKYEPDGRANLKGMTDSRMAMDKLMGDNCHQLVMINADERFGAGAADNFHTIADQLAKDLG